MTMTAISFVRVKEILSGAVAAWEKRTGDFAILTKHDPGFSFATKADLLQSQAFGFQLVSPDDITNQTGATANLVVALRTGVNGFPRMPIGGPFLSDAEIDEIVDWIDNGAPD